MKINNPKITFLINQDYTTIELYDSTSASHILEIRLTPIQLNQALSRLGHTECTAEIFNVDKVNKKMEILKHIFNIDGIDRYSKGSKEKIVERGLLTCPEGWEMDKYFQSQDSFFSDNGRDYARATIRRWVNSEQNHERSVATMPNSSNEADKQIKQNPFGG